MIRFMSSIFLLLVIMGTVLTNCVYAAIYKTVDKDGNVVYTDNEPVSGLSEEVQLSPYTIISEPEGTSITYPPKPVISTKDTKEYTRFEIIEPLSGATIHNKDSFNVRLYALPSIKPEHHFRLLLDGETIEDSSKQLEYRISFVHRGSHVITAQILNKNNKVVKSTKSTVYVHRAMVRSTDN